MQAARSQTPSNKPLKLSIGRGRPPAAERQGVRLSGSDWSRSAEGSVEKG